MRNRDFSFVALGRFLVVERYCETHQPSPTNHLRTPGPGRTGGQADKPDSRSGSRASARPQHG
jgi:hypothetical protein